jgi:hypothetical protein
MKRTVRDVLENLEALARDLRILPVRHGELPDDLPPQGPLAGRL